MIELLLVIKDLNNCANIINTINLANKNIRLYNITDNVKKVFDILKKHIINIIIIDYELFEQINVVDISKINNKINFMIVLGENEINYPNLYKNDFIFTQYNKLYKTLVNTINNSLIITDKIEIKQKINNELKYLGYNMSYYGTKYLAEIIFYLYNNYDYYDDKYIKNIYPILSRRYNKTENTIKGNITRATSMMFSDCKEDKLIEYLGTCSLPKCGFRLIIETILEKIKN